MGRDVYVVLLLPINIQRIAMVGSGSSSNRIRRSKLLLLPRVCHGTRRSLTAVHLRVLSLSWEHPNVPHRIEEVVNKG